MDVLNGANLTSYEPVRQKTKILSPKSDERDTHEYSTEEEIGRKEYKKKTP